MTPPLPSSLACLSSKSGFPAKAAITITLKKEGRKEGRKEVWGSSFSLCRSLETNPPNHHELPYDGGGGAATATAAVKSCTHGAKATFCLPSHLISGGSLLLPYRLKERVSELLQPTTAPLPQKTRRVELVNVPGFSTARKTGESSEFQASKNRFF